MFRLKTLKAKVLGLCILSTGIALLAAYGALATYDYQRFERTMVADIEGDAGTVADCSSAALSFKDENDAAQILSALRPQPQYVAACIYDLNGSRLATFFRDRAVTLPDFDQLPRGYGRFGTDRLETAIPVQLNGRIIGWVYLRSDLAALRSRMISTIAVFGTVLVGAAGLAILLAVRLGRAIVGPVEHLSSTVRIVSAQQDYSVRASRTTDDELGQLVDGFNAMLEQIQKRDEQLTLHRDHLEERVAARTAELLAAKQKAEEASRAKTAFLANMSHEIRTPMTAILGYADLMLSPQQTMSDRINCLQVVRRNARHLMDLINDILDISKIEAEKMTVEKIPCDPARIVVEVGSMLRAKAEAKGLSLTVEFVGDIPNEIRTDPLRLKQVLMNLTGNAIKFTGRGGVTLRLGVDRAGAGSQAWFEVRDTGIGMNVEQMSKLFQPFMQADESMTRKYGGTGLGLVISKRLANYMGGEVSVQSEVGKGSTFRLCVEGGPLEGVPVRTGLTESMISMGILPEAAEARISLDGRILLAEDGMDNQILLSMHLTAAGAEVVIAGNGRIAVEKLHAERFDLVLMDMQMPEMDGYAATRHLRQTGCTLPIIALTAHAMSGDREKCLAAGCTDYLTKPIDRELLLRTVKSYLPKNLPVPMTAVKPATDLPTGIDAAMQVAVAGFVSRLPARVDSLATFSAAGELEELRRLVHQLKGVGSGYGFPIITDAASRAESLIKATADCAAIRAAVDELIEWIRKTDGYDSSKEQHGQATDSHH
jgi:signal transduction histidine kinase/CheY-like chemotaxis protein/HPt (histidine-containing phosphotransfer) domain-containing protein